MLQLIQWWNHSRLSIVDGRVGSSTQLVSRKYILLLYILDGEIDGTATPRYNTAILQDMTHCRHTEKVLHYIQDSQSVRDAIVLLKVWLHQRELDIVCVNLWSSLFVHTRMSTKKLMLKRNFLLILLNQWKMSLCSSGSGGGALRAGVPLPPTCWNFLKQKNSRCRQIRGEFLLPPDPILDPLEFVPPFSSIVYPKILPVECNQTNKKFSPFWVYAS